MKNKKPNAERVWKLLEDQLVPRLPLSTTDRAVYSYLLRHSRLEGREEFRFSIRGLARHVHVSDGRTRDAVRRLADRGALRLVARSKEGHVVEVRLPEEIPLGSADGIEAREPKELPSAVNLEEADFMQNKALRQTIHARERGHCFYCLRRTDAHTQCLDHVAPRAKGGSNSYRNLVSCCLECNSLKGERSAPDFLRWLFRDRRLTASELHAALRALDALAAGKLPPPVQHPDVPVGPGGRSLSSDTQWSTKNPHLQRLLAQPGSASRPASLSRHSPLVYPEPRGVTRHCSLPRRGRPPGSRSVP